MDTLSSEERSRRMALVRSKNTKPEMRVRRLVYSMGYRYRLHDKRLPGKPDLAFIGKKKAIFVHGCFWHRHEGCVLARLPKSRLEFWEPKLEANRTRDLRKQAELEVMGWQVMIVWECEMKNEDDLAKRLREFLE